MCKMCKMVSLLYTRVHVKGEAAPSRTYVIYSICTYLLSYYISNNYLCSKELLKI